MLRSLIYEWCMGEGSPRPLSHAGLERPFHTTELGGGLRNAGALLLPGRTHCPKQGTGRRSPVFLATLTWSRLFLWPTWRGGVKVREQAGSKTQTHTVPTVI